ncbi:MAG: DUF4386 family protein [Steroidobacteraceae bacterium]|nr:DUF4386 family protein [Steroidobacteraceae bacterium]
MLTFQKSGGWAAFGAAATFIIGFTLYFALLIPAGYGSLEIDAVKHAAFLVENRSLLYAWNLIIYVIFGMLLVVVSLALHDRLKTSVDGLMQTATAFGLIWATLVIASGMVANIGASVVTQLFAKEPELAGTVWLSLMMIVNGLGGGNEIVGGVWVLLVSAAILRSRALPRAFGYLGLAAGLAGVITMIPPLHEAGSIFGLGLIVWFVWLGILLLRRTTETGGG